MNQILFVYTQLSNFKYFYQVLLLLFNINHSVSELHGFKYCYLLFVHNYMTSSIAIEL